MKGLSKFLKNKNTVTILGVLACLVILYAGYTMRINQKTALVTVYYANQTIQPKTLITAEMVSRTDVPESFIKGSYYRNYNDIIGKYSNYNTMIAKGSLFYSDLLVEEASLPDSIFYDIDSDKRLVSFPVNTVTTYGNSIMPSNIIDIYVKLYNDNGKLVYGELLEKIEVLAVKDAGGNNVFESTDESRTPAFVYFALPEEQYLLFSALNYIDTNSIQAVIVPNTVEYTPTADETDGKIATEITSEDLYNFVLSKIEQIDDQKELYTKLQNAAKQNIIKRRAERAEAEKKKTTQGTDKPASSSQPANSSQPAASSQTTNQ